MDAFDRKIGMFGSSFLVSVLLMAGPLLAGDRAQVLPELTITSFNIAWFGLLGTPNNELGSETRQPAIRKFMTDNQLWSDVLVFEEIVDVALLRREVVPANYNCISYENRDIKHQHVVLCGKAPLTLSKASDDTNFILEDVSLGNKRPAVHALVLAQNGQLLAHVIAVHLKASPDFSATRLQQTALIGEYLKSGDPHMPLVVVGDFNTHGTDTEDMLASYGQRGINFVDVALDGENTFRNRSFAHQFDRFFVRGLVPSGLAKVSGPCNDSDAALVSDYNRAVSDHCPITVRLQSTAGSSEGR